MPMIDRNLCQRSGMRASSLSRRGKGGIPADEAQYSFIPPAAIQPKSSANTPPTLLAHFSTLSGASSSCVASQP
jgi:hypothetical protein